MRKARAVSADARIKKAMTMLEEGVSVEKVSAELGYKRNSAVARMKNVGEPHFPDVPAAIVAYKKCMGDVAKKGGMTFAKRLHDESALVNTRKMTSKHYGLIKECLRSNPDPGAVAKVMRVTSDVVLKVKESLNYVQFKKGNRNEKRRVAKQAEPEERKGLIMMAREYITCQMVMCERITAALEQLAVVLKSKDILIT